MVGKTIPGWLCSRFQIDGISSQEVRVHLETQIFRLADVGAGSFISQRYTLDILIRLTTYQIIIRDQQYSQSSALHNVMASILVFHPSLPTKLHSLELGLDVGHNRNPLFDHLLPDLLSINQFTIYINRHRSVPILPRDLRSQGLVQCNRLAIIFLEQTPVHPFLESVALFDTAIPTVYVFFCFKVVDKSDSELTLVFGDIGKQFDFEIILASSRDLLFVKHLYLSAVVTDSRISGHLNQGIVLARGNLFVGLFNVDNVDVLLLPLLHLVQPFLVQSQNQLILFLMVQCRTTLLQQQQLLKLHAAFQPLCISLGIFQLLVVVEDNPFNWHAIFLKRLCSVFLLSRSLGILLNNF